MSTFNVVDSSGWLEYLADTAQAGQFAPAIEDSAHLLVPVIVLYEVFKKVLCERGENDALQVAAVMQTGRMIDLDAPLAMDAARHALPMADSLIYAATLQMDATLWTQDAHFQGLPHVKYFAKATSS